MTAVGPPALLGVGFTWSLFHHLMGGIRHAIWDAGLMFDPEGRELAAKGLWDNLVDSAAR